MYSRPSLNQLVQISDSYHISEIIHFEWRDNLFLFKCTSKYH